MAIGHTELTAMICMIDHQTIASKCAIPNVESNLHWIESAIYKNLFIFDEILNIWKSYIETPSEELNKRKSWQLETQLLQLLKESLKKIQDGR